MSTGNDDKQDANAVQNGSASPVKCANPECKCKASIGGDSCCQVCAQLSRESEDRVCECGHAECGGPLS